MTGRSIGSSTVSPIGGYPRGLAPAAGAERRRSWLSGPAGGRLRTNLARPPEGRIDPGPKATEPAYGPASVCLRAMALNRREKEEIARMVNDTLNNQFAFFARPVILKHLDSSIEGFPEWLRDKTVGEILDAYIALRANGTIGYVPGRSRSASAAASGPRVLP